MGAVSCHIENFDAAAFHYRHVAKSVVRQIRDGRSLEDISLQRARGFTVSIQDPVTGGRHCSIGGNFRNEFLVTSTLASQAPPAVGRALAIPLANKILGSQAPFRKNSISYVSIGEGSATNAHFLSAFNMARYSEHSKIKCPVVFVISDNKKCISLKGNGWIDKFVNQIGSSMYHDQADGSNALDLYLKSKATIDYSRSLGRPSLLLVNNLPRRFGHAATDRQDAYMSKEEITSEMERDPLSAAFSTALATGHLTEADFVAKFEYLQRTVEDAFDKAIQEPKINSRKELVDSNSQPLVPSSSGRAAECHYRYLSGENFGVSCLVLFFCARLLFYLL
jgi:2-oxoisovalerate dehydrogenase E1 component